MKANFEAALAFTLQDFSDTPDAIADLKAISDVELQEMYQKSYWSTVSGDELPAGIDLSVFDAGVATGPGTAVRQLQKAVDVSIDGKLGPVSLAAVGSAYNVAVLINLWSVQTAYYRSLPGFEEFGHDWLNRATWRLQAALDLAVR
jgi:lysozyme family protein